jgi:SPP1 family predicted phage head-tail adaptor
VPAVTAGKLRKRVTYQTPVFAVDSYGDKKKGPPSWATAGTFWAAVRPASGRELQNATQTKALVYSVVELRYQPSLTFSPDGRFLYGSRTLEITCVFDVDEGQRTLKVLCSEKVKGAA